MSAGYDELLRSAWDTYCDRLKAAGDLVLAGEGEASELDRAVGLQYLTRQVSRGLLLEIEHKDARFPQLFTLQTPVSKNFGDNPNCTYVAAYLDGRYEYRLTGQRGTVEWVRVSTRLLDPEQGLNYVEHLPPGPTLPQEDLERGEDGRFSVLIGTDPQPAPGEAALRIPPGPQQLFVRQFFGRWDEEQPMSLRLERVGAGDERPKSMSAARMVAGLDEAARFTEQDTARWTAWAGFYRATPNRFVSGRPDWAGVSREHERQGGRWLNFCYFDLAEDESLIVEFVPPQCSMWVVELNNRWMMSVDYRHHFSSINGTEGVAEDDGSVRIVVSNEDPGVPNWLDPAGHREGLLINRWVDPVEGEDPLPQARVVRTADLPRELADGRRIDEAGRSEQLRRMRAGVARRFPL